MVPAVMGGGTLVTLSIAPSIQCGVSTTPLQIVIEVCGFRLGCGPADEYLNIVAAMRIDWARIAQGFCQRKIRPSPLGDERTVSNLRPLEVVGNTAVIVAAIGIESRANRVGDDIATIGWSSFTGAIRILVE